MMFVNLHFVLDLSGTGVSHLFKTVSWLLTFNGMHNACRSSMGKNIFDLFMILILQIASGKFRCVFLDSQLIINLY